ncbi:TPA: YbfB/YjiJ family MFS transporter [Pseudomonas aeruginosa]
MLYNNSLYAQHYTSLQVVTVCLLTLVVTIGFSRFAYTSMLPHMLSNGVLDIPQAGWLASANYAGYFLGAATVSSLKLRPTTTLRLGLIASCLLIAAMGLVDSYHSWLTIRFLAGVVSAWTFVVSSQWGLNLLSRTNPGDKRKDGIIYTGTGIGIIISGALAHTSSWYTHSLGWLSISSASIAITLIVVHVLGKSKDIGSLPPPTSRYNVNQGTRIIEPVIFVGLYGISGFGYIIIATFLPVIAQRTLPVESIWPHLFWPLFGASLVFGAISFSRIRHNIDNRLALSASYILQALGITVCTLYPSLPGFIIGSILTGMPYTVIILSGMREARRINSVNALRLAGFATAAYALGQIIGPITATTIVSLSGGFSPALWIASGALTFGAIAFFTNYMFTTHGKHRSNRHDH